MTIFNFSCVFLGNPMFYCILKKVYMLLINKICINKSENVRLRYCDGRDKYLHPLGNKIYIFDKTACRTINSVSRMIN
jgi:hypothetical protein